MDGLQWFLQVANIHTVWDNFTQLDVSSLHVAMALRFSKYRASKFKIGKGGSQRKKAGICIWEQPVKIFCLLFGTPQKNSVKGIWALPV